MIWVLALAAYAADVDPATGLVVDDGLAEVVSTCTPCHSAQLVTQNRGSAEEWTRTIRWMQETQNLWDLPPELEAKVVGYLARNYPPEPRGRRANLPPELMPPPASAVVATESCGCSTGGWGLLFLPLLGTWRRGTRETGNS